MKIWMDVNSEEIVIDDEIMDNVAALAKQADTLRDRLEYAGCMNRERWNHFQSFQQELYTILAEIESKERK